MVVREPRSDVGTIVALVLLALLARWALAETPSGAPASLPAPVHDSRLYDMVLVDRFERADRDGRDANV